MRRRARPPSASPRPPRTSSGSALGRASAGGGSDAHAGARAKPDARSAYEAAVRYLAPRPRAVAEVRRHLLRKRFASDQIDAAIGRLQEHGFLDDAAFARYWLEQRARFRPKGALALRAELRAKGVDASAIDAVLAEQASEADETGVARAALAPRLARWRALAPRERKAKAQAFLRQRGFSFDAIAEVLAGLD